RPTSRFVAEFIGETNLIPGTVKSLGEDCEVETPVGVLRAARPDGNIEIGQSVQCSIRPESWRVNGGTENRLEAKLQSVMYLGAHEQYRALLTGGRETNADEE